MKHRRPTISQIKNRIDNLEAMKWVLIHRIMSGEDTEELNEQLRNTLAIKNELTYLIKGE